MLLRTWIWILKDFDSHTNINILLVATLSQSKVLSQVTSRTNIGPIDPNFTVRHMAKAQSKRIQMYGTQLSALDASLWTNSTSTKGLHSDAIQNYASMRQNIWSGSGSTFGHASVSRAWWVTQERKHQCHEARMRSNSLPSSLPKEMVHLDFDSHTDMKISFAAMSLTVKICWRKYWDTDKDPKVETTTFQHVQSSTLSQHWKRFRWFERTWIILHSKQFHNS